MAITAQQVKELRELTDCGIMDCKKALTECDGDIEKAKAWLAKGAQPTETVRSLLIGAGAMEKPAKLSAAKTKGKKSNK